ncbi:hypothetical protein A7K73_01880 [Candidatus Methylacidiphilum fumarolicum]|uniref:hypothetical protein n=1 Tax=Candidatus Methylacidiphilum fumarolicum TaxID=591154 RepID=UPI0005D412B6|nr:hypothetical protein [Candidatus Methylacidiphilum fumarolicum]MBW6415187.1 hypothetical protein [Candidatus Methylacidiphilum fumarolicum]TFE65936.1 hypothetical protein A7K73_01880 [Candidatus Methylacidiphilum fumarolicum]TFE77536.1 hypothetical protein A7D33_03950 [Candidatus Methylacidiphilum fumarolicum]
MQRSNYVNDKLYKIHSGVLLQSRPLEGGGHAGERQSAEGPLLLCMRVAGCALSQGKRVRNASQAPSLAKAGWDVHPGKGGRVNPPLYSLMDIREPR